MNLGNVIVMARKKIGLTQEDFAKKCGLSQNYISHIENNKREPNLKTIKQIGMELNIPVPILFFLALDESDIPNNKKEAFNIIAPTFQSFMRELFVK